MVLNVHRNHKGVLGTGEWGRGMEVRERERLYTYRYTVTTRMGHPALRWAAMRAILMFHNCEGQSLKTMSTDHNSEDKRIAEADSNRGSSAYWPNALPLGQTSSRADLSFVKALNKYEQWHQARQPADKLPIPNILQKTYHH